MLATLELRELPDRTRLQKHFSRLLKRYHPDRNRDRSDWAHEKTRAIIAANHRLRKFLDSRPFFGTVQGTGRPPAYERPRTAPPEETRPPESPPGEGFPVQLVRAPLGNFALPVRNIERILAFDRERVTELTPGDFVFLYNTEVYRLYDLNGDPPAELPGDSYLILFRGRSRFGLLTAAETRFASIENFSSADLRRSFLEGTGELQLFFQTERFVFPARLRRLL